MSVESSAVDPQFFGKDSFVPFIGQVEDVNDPKRSNRVRVRCMGWHPATKDDTEEEDGLKTEDLPWAKVGMPTTMSMQGRTGGKHGLRVGSWVFGFFADGYDAQEPFVLTSFAFTSKSTEKNISIKTKTPEGTLPKEEKAFKVRDNTQTGDGKTLKDEEGGADSKHDISHNTIPDDSTNGKCPIPESAATALKHSQKNTGNEKGQIYKPDIADGLCGASQGARDKVAKIFEEMFPSQLSRFSFDDQVWDALSGRYINLNGVFNKMSVEISNLMRAPIQSEKGNIEKMTNKMMHSVGVFGSASRDEITALTADFALSSAGDVWHTAFNSLIQDLGGQVMQSIKNLDAQEIFDVASMSLADSVITDVSDNFQKVLGESTETRNESASAGEEYVVEMKGKIDSTTAEDYESDTLVQTAFEGEEGFGVDVLTSGTDFFGESEEEGGGGFLSMLTDFEFLQNPKLFNKAGLSGVLDMVTKEGCQAASLFSTDQGLLGSMAGVGGDVTGGGSESGKSSKEDDFVKKNIGFGGLPQNEEFTPTTEPQEDAQTTRMSDSERKLLLELTIAWQPVDLHESGRTYVLQGEQLIDGQQSDNSRVLVDNQDNPSENGIYITSPGDWERSKDANLPSHFKNEKYVEIPKPNVEDRYYVYRGINNPRVDNQPIVFERLYYR
jgi:hypothetical protein